ncbi:DnaJ-like protein DjlA [Pseudovibrio sp. W64]|uniref:molecular chaperone DjiA n=1 Tax=Pseudovibrio sp. W64 TaxID=1735583 RepID=UPI0007AE8E2A|nr:molecular chaperone DjiA [Pseudovibrio sp. W64]KZK79080.1 DnaJ-like protein DjlA [Pseudovibrio sp. W64]
MSEDLSLSAQPPENFWQKLLRYIELFLSDVGNILPRFGQGEDSVAFSIALIALCAKLAKADGLVTNSEVSVFRSIVEIPPEEEGNAIRVFNLCRQDVAGYQSYARQIHKLLGEGEHANNRRCDVMDALFHIAMADDVYHADEEHFLEEVAEIFHISQPRFEWLKARHIPDSWNASIVLEVHPDAPAHEIRNAWLAKVKENHPDRLIATGAPQEMLALATSRIKDINKAYDELKNANMHYSPQF